MRRIVGLLVVIFSIFGVGSTAVDAQAVPSWIGDAPTVVKNIPLSVSRPSWCDGYEQQRFVLELGASMNACLFGDDRMIFGYGNSGGTYRGVVQFPYSNELHILEGVCEVVCRYSVTTDILVTRQRIGQFTWGVVVYAHASDRVKRTQNPNGSVRYTFDRSDPQYEMKNNVGRYLSNPSFAISSNGRWIVAELQDSGLALVDMTNYSTRQITMSGYRYGFGFDPVEQLAVSNDGKSVALMGQNAGFNVTEVTSGCGQELIGDLSRLPATVLCRTSDLGIGAIFPNFYLAEQPRFYGDGYQLEFIVRGWVEHDRKVVLLAHGATSAHKLKLLALGDSFISGEGETDDTMYRIGTNEGYDKCHVSKRSYPLLVANRIGITGGDVQTIACAGARTTDIVGSTETYWGQGDRLGKTGLNLSQDERSVSQEVAVDTFQPGRALQESFLERYDPEKILIGIGGNDAGLMGKLRTCVMPGTCEWANEDGRQATADEIKRLYGTLGAVFARIARSNGTAQVYVVGYPNIIHSGGVCDPITGVLLDYNERVFIEKSIEYLNQIIQAAAKKAEFTYLDIEHSMDGKRLCSGSNSTAMNGLRLGDDIAVSSALPMLKIVGAETFHPTPTGHALITDSILEGHPNLHSDSSCVNDPMLCGMAEPSIEPSNYWQAGDLSSGPLLYRADFALQSSQDFRHLAVTVPKGTLEPGSVAQIELRSAPVSLGLFAVDDQGGMDINITLPEDTEVGFHTLHLLAKSREAKAVDMYQFIDIDRNGDSNDEKTESIGSKEALVNVQLPNLTATNISAPTQKVTSFGLTTSLEVADPVKSEVLGVSKILTPTMPVEYLKSSTEGSGTVLAIIIGGIVAVLVSGCVVLLRRRWVKLSS